MQANVASPLQESTVEAEIVALRQETAARRLELERQFPNGMFESLLNSAKRRVSDTAIQCRCSLLRATWCLKNWPRDRGQLVSEWKTERQFDLVAMFEMYNQAGIGELCRQVKCPLKICGKTVFVKKDATLAQQQELCRIGCEETRPPEYPRGWYEQKYATGR